jgi:DNA-binding MarR family transcriptional regulator
MLTLQGRPVARTAGWGATSSCLPVDRAVADRVGLHVTDLRCLNLLANAGPLTAGELGQQLGLGTTGAVTPMVDRLERAGYLRRQPDPRDCRRVIIQPVPEQLAAIGPHDPG